MICFFFKQDTTYKPILQGVTTDEDEDDTASGLADMAACNVEHAA